MLLWPILICLCFYIVVSFGRFGIFAKTITQTEATNKKEHYIDKSFITHKLQYNRF